MCQTPPEELCLPVDPALGITAATLKDFRLYDCTPGECEGYVPTALRDGTVCFKASTTAGQPVCENGCAFGGVITGPPGWLLPLIIILIVLAALALIIVLLIARRRREATEETDEEEDLVIG